MKSRSDTHERCVFECVDGERAAAADVIDAEEPRSGQHVTSVSKRRQNTHEETRAGEKEFVLENDRNVFRRTQRGFTRSPVPRRPSPAAAEDINANLQNYCSTSRAPPSCSTSASPFTLNRSNIQYIIHLTIR